MVKPLTSKRHFLFKVIAIALPFVFFFLIEIFLRSINYGYDTRIFVQDKSDINFTYLNPEISKKYFTYADNAPVFLQERFKKIKPANTFRIFVLGESSAQGYPYFHNGTFPRILKYKLQRAYPSLNFEVINLSITAVNSYTLLDIAKEVVHQQPDAIAIYSGHNEYYGALGVGSTQRLGSSPFLVNVLIQFKSFRTFQALTNLYGTILTSLHPDVVDQKENLMKRMASEQKIPYKSTLYHAGIDQFNQNMESILKTFSKKGVPVFIGSLVNNEKDLKPFISEFHVLKDSVKWKKYFQEGVALKSSNGSKAMELFNQANALDSTHALLHYYMGMIAYEMKDFNWAKASFARSIKFDVLRFRSPTEINKSISWLAQKYRAHHVDVMKDFEMNSPHGIVGAELLTEHIHPNINGYFVMAESFFKNLTASGIIKIKPFPINALNFRKEYPFTKMDSLKGVYEIMMLKERWPFNEPIHDTVSSKGSYEAKLAGGLSVNQYDWATAMNLLYKHYEKEDNKIEMLKIMEGFVLEYPDEYQYNDAAALLSRDLNNTEKSIFYFTNAFQLKPSFVLAKSIFLEYLKIDKPTESKPYIDYVISHNESKTNFIPLKNIVNEVIRLKVRLKLDSSNVTITNSIGEKYFLIGNQQGAKNYFNKTLRIQSNNKIALDNLAKIY